MQDHLYVDLSRSSLFSINVSLDSPRKNKTHFRFVTDFPICFRSQPVTNLTSNDIWQSRDMFTTYTHWY